MSVAEWHWPQGVIAALTLLSVVAHISKHGQPRGPYNGPAAAIAAAINVWVLWCGGFWG